MSFICKRSHGVRTKTYIISRTFSGTLCFKCIQCKSVSTGYSFPFRRNFVFKITNYWRGNRSIIFAFTNSWWWKVQSWAVGLGNLELEHSLALFKKKIKNFEDFAIIKTKTLLYLKLVYYFIFPTFLQHLAFFFSIQLLRFLI